MKLKYAHACVITVFCDLNRVWNLKSRYHILLQKLFHFLVRCEDELRPLPTMDEINKLEGAVETKVGKENCRTLAQEEEMKRLKEATARQQNDQLNDTKRKWSNFFEEATKLSKQKKRKINSAKRREKKEKKDVEKRILQYWEQLYWDRHNSHEDFRRYLNTPVPEWLESHNFLVDPSHDMLRRTDMKYDGNDFHRYKLIASTHKN